jgi:hypothetical protein
MKKNKNTFFCDSVAERVWHVANGNNLEQQKRKRKRKELNNKQKQ